jgi:inorganic pyrophosphatase
MADALHVDVVVEVPKGSRNKFEWDPAVNAIRLDRELFTATRYPADYGFVIDTLGEDGDRSMRWSSSASPPSPDAISSAAHSASSG